MDTETLIKTIIDAAYRVRSSFMPGYLESIYENALIVELEVKRKFRLYRPKQTI